MILKFYILSAVLHSRRGKGVVMVWRVATVPMSCYIVRTLTTRSVPRRLSTDVAAACGAVILRFHGDSNPYKQYSYIFATWKNERYIPCM